MLKFLRVRTRPVTGQNIRIDGGPRGMCDGSEGDRAVLVQKIPHLFALAVCQNGMH